MINYFRKGGTFTNVDITKLDGYDKDNPEHEDIAWSTEKVNQVIKDYQDGIIELSRIKNSPFLSNDITFRKPHLTFQYTSDEIKELKKCAQDPIYFADKYCKLFTDKGYQPIKLRDYQQGLLEGFVKHRQCIVLASRQIGKCMLGNSIINVRNKNTKEIMSTTVGSFFENVKNISNLVDDSGSCKFIESYNLKDWEVETDTGFDDISIIHKTIPYDVWNITTEDFNLECADEHILFDENMKEVYVRDIREGDYIQTKNGVQKVISIGIEDREKENMYDLELSNGTNHRYYTNGILSHNTTTSAIFILWYILFNKEKNVLMLGDILDTTKEIIDKLKQIMNNLPFFMKPGILINNVQSMKLDNGCRIIGRSTTKKSAIGLSINLLYMDEFAHISANFIDDFWRSTYPTISGTPDSRIIITSTPNGMNKFNVIWNGAIDATENKSDSNFFPLRVDWWQVKGRDEEWKQKTIADLGSVEDFNQEYGLQFFKGDNLLLNSSDIKKLYNIKTRYISRPVECMKLQKTYFKEGEIHKTNTDFSEFLTWHPSFLKNTFTSNMYDLKKDDNYYVLGIDTAKGVGRDYHVCNIFKVAPMPINRVLLNKNNIEEEIDVFSIVQVGKFRTNTINIETFSDCIESIVFNLFNPEHVRIGIELNNQGSLVRDKLIRNTSYWTGMIIFNKKSDNDVYYEPGTNLSSNKMKVMFCEKFQQNVSIDRIITTDEITFSELSNFGSNDNRSVYRCQTGHDDIAMSCIHANAFIDSPQYKEICWELWDKMKSDPNYEEYIKVVEKDVIEDNATKFETGPKFDLREVMSWQ